MVLKSRRRPSFFFFWLIVFSPGISNIICEYGKLQHKVYDITGSNEYKRKMRRIYSIASYPINSANAILTKHEEKMTGNWTSHIFGFRAS